MAKKKKNSKQSIKNSQFSTGEFLIYIAAFAVIGVFTLWVSLAAPNKGGKGGGGSGGSGTLSLVMVTDNNSDGLPNWGDTITYNVSTSSTTMPYVSTTCYQGGSLVLSGSAGWFASYPWPDAKNIPLKTQVWTSGAADCTARLYMSGSRGSTTTLGTLSFHVNA